MKSELNSELITFSEIMLRLRDFIRCRINSGEFTERSLARVVHISQPHLHNMLKGMRQINPIVADKIMSKFKIGILDLFELDEIWQLMDYRNADWADLVASRKPAAKAKSRIGVREALPRNDSQAS